jgi:ABC-2 type transport system permease protein
MKPGFSVARAAAMARKEVIHVLRDPFTLALALGMPVLLVTFFGIAIDFNPKDLRLAVHDADRSAASRQLTEVFEASGYFQAHASPSAYRAIHDLDTEKAKAALVIEPRFEKRLGSATGSVAQVIVDGADNSTVGVILGYLQGIQDSASAMAGRPRLSPVELRTRFLFNPELNTRWFIVPGLTVVVIAILSVLLTALTVAREWENGSMELLLSTPVRPLEIILGKLAPYAALGITGVFFVYLIARLFFRVPFVGSHLLFSAGTLMFLTAYLAQGLVISVVTRRQQLAMQLSLVSGLLPSLLLSGFIFPIENMPVFFRYLTMILPARWFMAVCRGIFLKGASFSELALPFAALAALDVGLIVLAARKFKRDLEP